MSFSNVKKHVTLLNILGIQYSLDLFQTFSNVSIMY
jgi:hypothetical protein